MVLIRAFLVWLVIIAAEMVHGILRGVLLVPIVRRPPGPENRRPDRGAPDRGAPDLRRGLLVHPVDCSTDQTPISHRGAALGRAC